MSEIESTTNDSGYSERGFFSKLVNGDLGLANTVPEYGRYFWRRRHDKASRLLPALSAREYRAMAR